MNWSLFMRQNSFRVLLSIAVLCFAITPTSASDSESQQLAIIRILDESGKLSEAHEKLKKLVKSKDDYVRAEAWLYQAKILAANNHITDALVLLEKSLTSIDVGTELWARIMLEKANELRAQEQDEQSLLTYQEINLKRPHGIISFQAAVGCGDLLVKRGDNKAALQVYQWAQQLAAKEFYDQVPASVDLAGLKAKIAQLGKPKRKSIADTLETDSTLFAEAEANRHAKKWSLAIAKYESLLSRYPDSKHIPRSEWGIGFCQSGAGKLDLAIKTWAEFISKDPAGEYRGQAWSGIFDVYLLKKLDPQAARAAIDNAWSAIENRKQTEVEAIQLSWKQAGYEIGLRKGLMSCLANNYKEGLKWFQKAQEYCDLRKENTDAVPSGWNSLPTDTERLIARCQSGQPLTPPGALDSGYDKASLILFLGDFSYECGNRKEAAERFSLITSRSDIKSSDSQRAYAWFRLGESRHWFAKQDDIGACYETSLTQYPKSPWAARAMLNKGIWEYSQKKLPEKALATYTELANRFPDAPEAQSALWFIGVIFYWDKDWERAKIAWDNLNKRYPKNEWKELLANEYLPAIEKNIKLEQGQK